MTKDPPKGPLVILNVEYVKKFNIPNLKVLLPSKRFAVALPPGSEVEGQK
jgi:hypothetical protein